MTISTEENTVISVIGPVSAGTPIPITFSFSSSPDIVVYKVTIADGATVKLSINTDYTITGSNLYLVSGITSSYKLVIDRATLITQLTEYTESGKFPAKAHEYALDKLTRIAKELSDKVKVALRFPADSIASGTLPYPIAGKAIRINDTADGLALSTVNVDDMKTYLDQANTAATIAQAAVGSMPAPVAINYLRQNATGTGLEYRTPAQTRSDISVYSNTEVYSKPEITAINHNGINGLNLACDSNFSQLSYIGTPTYDNTTGKWTLNGSNQGVVVPTITDFSAGTWEIRCRFQSASNSTNQHIFTNYTGGGILAIALDKNSSNKLAISLGNTTSWNITSSTIGTKSDWSTSLEYYIRFKFTGSQYLVDWSTDGNTWTNDITVTSSVSVGISLNQLVFGYNQDLGGPFAGTIRDLKVIKNSITILDTSLSYNGNTQIAISTGSASDSTNTVSMVNPALINKHLNATFTAGSGNGGLDTGSKAVSTWYSVFAISKADGVVDILFSLSSTNPTMPSGYTYKRRIGSIKTDSSGNIMTFYQKGDLFLWAKGYICELINNTTVSTYTNLTVSVPPLCQMLAQALNDAATNGVATTLGVKDKVTNTTFYGHLSYYGSRSVTNFSIFVDSSSQIQYITSFANGTGPIYLYNTGYIDSRGKN